MTGAESIARTLANHRVRMVFGVPGSQTLALYDAISATSIRLVTPTSELAAGFMAGGFARACGATGVLLVIPGPGLMYAMAPIAEARLDSTPLVVITTGVDRTGEHPFRSQDIDQPGILRPIVKAIVECDQPMELSASVQRAFGEAEGGEPGPVLLQLEPRCLSALSRLQVGAAAEAGAHGDLAAVAARLAAARRPVLYLGGGAQAAAEPLRRLASGRAIPVVTTTAGRGIVDEATGLVVGSDLGLFGFDASEQLMTRSDLILMLGCKGSDNATNGFRLTLAPDKLIRIDQDATVLGANYPASLAIEGDVARCVALLEQRLGSGPGTAAWSPTELITLRQAALRDRTAQAEPTIAGMSPADFFAWLQQGLPPDAIVVTDSGRHQTLTRRHWCVRHPRGLLAPTNFQSMGYGLAGALGAKLAAPGRRVIAIMGDGGMAMSGMELLTAARLGLDLTVLVLVDGQLGQIQQGQRQRFGRTIATDLANPAFAGFAASVGANYVEIGAHPRDPDHAVLAGLSGPTLVVVSVTDRTASVLGQNLQGSTRRIIANRLKPRARALWHRLLAR